ncbi:hypothetical protein [Paenibacillus oryzisoli]|uniref:YtkA-like domain-containing protein n=1 Tax=Paenibacillus oryzisoli TaxID=1850517 RepID=A0A198A224_9BACL|nr:hypothetical protein [Paenibacillus oryzisoli]OAS15071.1 hypothetical protein A8708_22330 [Paenibacillus oryzisoli]
MNKRLQRVMLWGFILLWSAVLPGCTAKIAETGENGLRAHLTVDMHLPKQLELNTKRDYSIEILKNNEPQKNAEQAEFVFWPEGNKEAAITLKATETAPGMYSVSHSIEKEGIYLVQSRVSVKNEKVYPIKRFAVGATAVEQLIQMESAKESSEDSHSGHH